MHADDAVGTDCRLCKAGRQADAVGESPRSWNAAMLTLVCACMCILDSRVLCNFSTWQRMFNARCETIDTSPVFRRLVNSKRCVVPFEGFFGELDVFGECCGAIVGSGSC